MIKITYFYSACVAIETNEISVLCDPWFTEGIYDGAWFHYPPIDPSKVLARKFDYIYVSHIHPDHYDPTFLKEYLAAHPRATVVIGEFQPNYLSRKMTADGIPHAIKTEFGKGPSECRIFLNPVDPADIDSALVVRRKGHSVVNMNDNLFCQAQISHILDYCGDSIDIALLGYTGAGPYPQTYYRDEGPLSRLASAKKEQFFARYRDMKTALNPKKIIPFAGKYVLGGKLTPLNNFRGVADATEVSSFDPDAIVLADGGSASIDTASLTATEVRTKPYDPDALRSHLDSLGHLKMDYEEYFNIPLDRIPLKRLLPKAYRTALSRSVLKEDYYFCISIGHGQFFVMNANPDRPMTAIETDLNRFEPRSEVEIAPAYLFGLITGVFHWNNAEVGSQYLTTRVPDLYNAHAQNFLNFFHL